MSRVAIYARVSTGDQTTENQLQQLHRWAKRSGHEVVKVYEDKGISGSKGRDKRPVKIAHQPRPLGLRRSGMTGDALQ